MRREGQTLARAKEAFIERRKYVRLPAPMKVSYTVPGSGNMLQTLTKDISADGLRFETPDASLKESSVIEVRIEIPDAPNPVHAKGKVVWRRRVTLEDGAPYDCGIELMEIEEDNKNTFL
jgi:c-di-GMP-binding flagellar brake protein YcgR